MRTVDLLAVLDDVTDMRTGVRLDTGCDGNTITLRFTSREARDSVLDMLDELSVDWNERGRCDTCGAFYDLASRDGRCGDCGECAAHCRH